MDVQTDRIDKGITTNHWIRQSDGIRVSYRVEGELPSLQRLATLPLLATLWGALSAFVQNEVSSIAYQNDRLGMQIISLLTFTAC